MRNIYSVRRTEPDMRAELQRMFDGDFPEISKKQWGVFRKMQRDDNDGLIPCPCVDVTTGEPDLDTFCPVCWGEGSLWDESFISIYRVILSSDTGQAKKERVIAPGLMNIQTISFFTTYEKEITDDDKIIELKLQNDGKPVLPYKRKKLYRIGTSIDLRSDNGKLEYWKLNCYQENRKFLNGATI